MTYCSDSIDVLVCSMFAPKRHCAVSHSDGQHATFDIGVKLMITHSKETMMDDKTKRGGQDWTKINVNQDYELRDWSDKFGVTTHAKLAPSESAICRANSNFCMQRTG